MIKELPLHPQHAISYSIICHLSESEYHIHNHSSLMGGMISIDVQPYPVAPDLKIKGTFKSLLLRAIFQAKSIITTGISQKH